MELRSSQAADPILVRTEQAEANINDQARLAALRGLDLEGLRAQEAIDGLSRVASRLLSAPVSLVTVVEAERQIFIGQHGLDGDLARLRETPLSHSFCKHAVSSERPLVVSDARVDPVVRHNLAIRDMGVIAYAGIPLVLQSGEAVGAICAIDDRPRHWSEDELEVLEDLAGVAAALLDARAELVHRGLHDRLTGLPNRDLLIASCEDLIASSAADEHVAVLCAGIDHFNMVNQAFGADRADRVLQAVAERLTDAARETDVFGRLRGDVFVLVAQGIRDEAEALSLASRVHRVLSSRPLEIDGETLSVGVTMGIAVHERGTTAADLISEAANAMREAKRSQGRVRVSEADRTGQAAAQIRMREALRHALARGEINAVFQPIVALEGRIVVGFETLARWESEELGAVSPEEFIPLAELTSEIVPIGVFVLERAAELAAAIKEESGEELRVTLNAPPLLLEQRDFAQQVQAAFESRGLTGRSLGIEITEGALLESGPLEEGNLESLREFGARILLDDFGTGYSALGYLRNFRIDTIKIDRSFVAKMSEERHSAALIQAILAMARGLDMEVVAEGVESEDQAKLLSLLGCRFGQGFGLGRPVSAERAMDGLKGRPAS